MIKEQSNINYKSIGIQIFLLIILSKLIYICLEYFYNIKILDVSSSNNFYNELEISKLNENGHKISAIGISLLITPLFYFIYKKISNIYYMYLSYIITFITIFIISYNSLDKLVNYIIEKNLNKSYEAYYLNIFKVGLLGNYFDYESFIKNENIINNKLTIEEKLLFINSFILLNADENLLNKLKEKGKEKFLNIYIDQHKEDFKEQYNKYMLLDNEIENSYNDFNNEKTKIKSKLNQGTNVDIDKEYNSLINNLKKEYNIYVKKINKNKNLINDINALKDLQNKLDTYLSNKTKYESNYRNKMQSTFGHYIEPENFLDNNGKSNIIKIKNFVKENVSNNEISFEEFKLLNTAKKEIYKELSNKGFKPQESVDYTIKSNFENLINNTINKKINSIEPEFKRGLLNKFGKNDLSLNMDYDKFINSNFIKTKIEYKLKDFNLDKNKINDIIFVLNTEKHLKENTFKNKLYLNMIKENKIIEKYMFEKNDFETNEKAKELGKLSIQLLYIPMFALIISMLSLLLNLISLFSLIIVKSFNLNYIYKLIISFVFIITLIVLPYINNTNILNNNLLNQLDSNSFYYIKFLEFICYYEKLLSF